VVAPRGDELPADVVARPLYAVLDPEPILSPALWTLATWIAGYYVAPLGMVLKTMLPSRLLRPPRASATVNGSGAAAAGRGVFAPPLRSFIEPLVRELPPGLERRAPAQARALASLLASGGRVEAAALARELEISPAVLRALDRAGLARLSWAAVPGPRPEGISPRGEVGYEPTPDQARALDHLAGRLRVSSPASPVRPVLLHGVTGSGKTLVYLRLVEEALAVGGDAIVLVPEIGLTPRAAARFREAFGDRVALLHSALSEGERWEAWRAMRTGEVRVAVGPRSAVFAPLPSVRAIVVDEEHEASYKQEESPRYNAREVAIVRARLEGAVAVLGSATPALESCANARAGKFDLVELPRRVAQGGLPMVEVVDLREEAPGDRILSRRLRAALAETLARREQALLLQNRRGFSAFLQCRDCGRTWQCPNCRITLTLHRPRGGRGVADLRCHYCDHREAASDVCPDCGGLGLSGQGIGTQQVEELVAGLFPGARVARMDLDTTSRKGSHGRLVEAMERGDLDVLVGTQMVAKGHDFPGLTLVGVVSADTGLNVPDFRAAERTFQLVAQVAGRPGRRATPGRVIVQSHIPDHPAIQAAARHDYASFYADEAAARAETSFPPSVKLARCLFSGETAARVESAARALGGELAELARARRLGEKLGVVGPSEAPLARLRGRSRWHLLLKSTSPRTLQSSLRSVATRWRVPPGVQLVIDRDPYDLL
jgi:primosomal protein N' (replication factor Y)